MSKLRDRKGLLRFETDAEIHAPHLKRSGFACHRILTRPLCVLAKPRMVVLHLKGTHRRLSLPWELVWDLAERTEANVRRREKLAARKSKLPKGKKP